jgi:hypothetical protein
MASTPQLCQTARAPVLPREVGPAGARHSTAPVLHLLGPVCMPGEASGPFTDPLRPSGTLCNATLTQQGDRKLALVCSAPRHPHLTPPQAAQAACCGTPVCARCCGVFTLCSCCTCMFWAVPCCCRRPALPLSTRGAGWLHSLQAVISNCTGHHHHQHPAAPPAHLAQGSSYAAAVHGPLCRTLLLVSHPPLSTHRSHRATGAPVAPPTNTSLADDTYRGAPRGVALARAHPGAQPVPWTAKNKNTGSTVCDANHPV